MLLNWPAEMHNHCTEEFLKMRVQIGVGMVQNVEVNSYYAVLDFVSENKTEHKFNSLVYFLKSLLTVQVKYITITQTFCHG